MGRRTQQVTEPAAVYVTRGAHGWLFGESLIAEISEALKRFRRVPELGRCPLTQLSAVARYRQGQCIADDAVGRAYALRAVLRQALGRLAACDPAAAALLESRFVRGEPLAAFETRGLARATVLRHSRRALEALAWEFWAIEQEARDD
jgi:hypothetical protein